MAQKKRKKTTRSTANGVPLAAKLARDRMLREAMQQAAHDATVQVESDIRTQRALWLSVASIADAYGFGPERIKKFFAALQDNSKECEHMKNEVDEDYAQREVKAQG